MADSYIDPHETQAYGPYTRAQIEAVLLPLEPRFEGALRFVIETQRHADETMAVALAKLPTPTADADAAIDEARDTLVRFTRYVGSIKGEPVPVSEFLGRDTATTASRRRLAKLVPILQRVVATIDRNAARLPGVATWREELVGHATVLGELERAQRAHRNDRAVARPEVSEARTTWLRTYEANKRIVSALLAAIDKESLLAAVFDDLSETHHAPGVHDTPETDAAPKT